MAFQDHREKVGVGNVPDLPAMGGNVCKVRNHGRDTVLVSLKGVVRLLAVPGLLFVLVFIHELRGIPLTHLLDRLMDISPGPVGRAPERVVEDKRPYDRIERGSVSAFSEYGRRSLFRVSG